MVKQLFIYWIKLLVKKSINNTPNQAKGLIQYFWFGWVKQYQKCFLLEKSKK